MNYYVPDQMQTIGNIPQNLRWAKYNPTSRK